MLEITPRLRPHGAPNTVYQCLTFQLGAAEYGIDILQVQEIRSYVAPTRIANGSPELLGVIDLRGVIVPIIDARLKFNYPVSAYTATTVVIVLNLQDTVLGVVVDAVSDVVHLAQDDIKPPPLIYTHMDAGFVTGLAHVGERMLILIDTGAFMAGSVPQPELLTATVD